MESKFDYESLIDEIMDNLLILKIDENYEEDKYNDVL